MKRKSCWAFLLFAVAMIQGCAPVPYRQTAGISSAAFHSAPPHEALIFWQQAEQELKAGDLNAAIHTWRNLARSYPQYSIAPRSLRRVGEIYLEQEQADLAVEYFNYIMDNYPQWEGIASARLNRLEALSALGQKQQVLQEGTSLWQTSSGNSEIQTPLALLMADAYQETGDRENALKWLEMGFASTPGDRDMEPFIQSAINVLEGIDESTVRRLLDANPSETMRGFLEFRLAQIEKEKGETDAAHQRLLSLLNSNPSHPLAPQIRDALGEIPTASSTALQGDRIGCLAPINGNYAKFGKKVVRGFTLAAEDWNGLHPEDPVTLIIKDTQADPDIAMKAMEELVQKEGVIGIVGPLSASAAKRVAPSANEWSVPLLTLTRQDEEIPSGPFVLHVFLDNREMVKSLVRYCRETLGYKSFATLYPNDRYGQTLSNVFAEVVRESGGNLLASVPYEGKMSDFKEPIQKLITIAQQTAPQPTVSQKAPFEALFIPDQAQTVSLIAPQLLHYNLLGATLLGTNLWAEVDLVQVGGVYTEQAIFVTPFFPGSQASPIQTFRDRFQTLYQASPSYLEAQAYDALMLLLEARHRLPSGSIERNSLLREILQTRDFRGLTGNHSFTSQGELIRDYIILQVQNGRIVQRSSGMESVAPTQGPGVGSENLAPPPLQTP